MNLVDPLPGKIGECGVSGSKPLQERPPGAKLLKALAPGDVVITPKLDRMFRSALNALDILKQLQARKVHLHMGTSKNALMGPNRGSGCHPASGFWHSVTPERLI